MLFIFVKSKYIAYVSIHINPFFFVILYIFLHFWQCIIIKDLEKFDWIFFYFFIYWYVLFMYTSNWSLLFVDKIMLIYILYEINTFYIFWQFFINKDPEIFNDLILFSFNLWSLFIHEVMLIYIYFLWNRHLS